MRRASIRGNVLLCDTKEPLPGIRIITGTLYTTSNVQGYFKLAGLTASFHEVSFKLEGFETTGIVYDLAKTEEIESTVMLVDAFNDETVCIGGESSRAIRLMILDASTKEPIPFAFVKPFKRCSKHSGQVLLNCMHKKPFRVLLDIKADGYSRWQNRVDFPADKTEVTIYLKRNR